MKNIPDGSVDLVLADPPYGTMNRKTRRPEKRLDDITWDFALDEQNVLQELSRVLRPNGKALLFSQEPYTSKLILANVPSLPFSQRLHWKKNVAGNFLCSSQNCMQYIEDICLFSKNSGFAFYDFLSEHPLREYNRAIFRYIGKSVEEISKITGSTYNSHYWTEGFQFSAITEKDYKIFEEQFLIQFMDGYLPYCEIKKIDNEWKKRTKEKRKQYYKEMSIKYPSVFNLWQGGKSKSNVLEYKKDNDGYHPTQKPVALLEDLIQTYSNEGNTVLDFTAGSMSTVIACINTNRNCIAIEKDEHYFSVGCKRVHDHILENNIDLCYNQVCGGVCLWQSSKTEQVKDMVGF